MNPHAGCIYWYGRYIDDIIIIWMSNVLQQPQFIDYLNCKAFGFAFTYQLDHIAIPYLDICLSIDKCKGIIHTCTYRKPTASNNILHAKSCHPNPTIRGLPLGELVRAKRNCFTSNSFYIEKEEILSVSFRKQDYSEGVFRCAEKIVDTKNRNDLLSNTFKEK